jgi:hypothetical protein
MRRNVHHPAILFLLVGLLGAPAAFAASDNFSSNPLAPGSPWSFGVGDNSHSQFSWSPGALSVHLDSSLPTARLDLPLGTTLGDSSSFQLSARFSFNVTSAPGDQFAQIAFGLTNHTVTGGDRTGSLANFSSDNTFDTMEFNYFPNVSPSFGGPTLTPVVFGGPNGGDGFSNFAPTDFTNANLGGHAVGITELPQNIPLEAHLAYDGTSKTVTLSIFEVVGSALVLLDTEQNPLDLATFGSGYDASHPFQLDTLSIMSYNDAFTTPQKPSLVADITYQSIKLVTVPEPSTVVLAIVAATVLLPLGRRLRHRRAKIARVAEVS